MADAAKVIRGLEFCLKVACQASSGEKYERAKKDIRNFLLKVKRLREKRGLEELKYAGTIEENEEGRHGKRVPDVLEDRERGGQVPDKAGPAGGSASDGDQRVPVRV